MYAWASKQILKYTNKQTYINTHICIGNGEHKQRFRTGRPAFLLFLVISKCQLLACIRIYIHIQTCMCACVCVLLCWQPLWPSNEENNLLSATTTAVAVAATTFFNVATTSNHNCCTYIHIYIDTYMHSSCSFISYVSKGTKLLAVLPLSLLLCPSLAFSVWA